MNTKDFDKQFFIQSWPDGYYENFSYGVGIESVCKVCLYPFVNSTVRVLEIGSGGGVFSQRIWPKAGSFTCIDVIPRPNHFPGSVEYIELDNQDYNCTFVQYNSIDFTFAYNVFCHFSNDAIRQYLKSVHRVLRPGGDFVFMLSAYGPTPMVDLGALLPMGHFAQNEKTLPLVIGAGWEIVSPNMIPEHRDIIVHLKKYKMDTQELKKKIAVEIRMAVMELNKKIKTANDLRMRVVVNQQASPNGLTSPDVNVSVYENISY